MRVLRSCWFLRWCVLLTAGLIAVPYLLALLQDAGDARRGGGRLRGRAHSEFGNGSWLDDNYYAPYPEWMLEVEARMAERKAHLRAACSLFGLDAAGNDSLHRPNPWEFLVDRKHHLVWCNVFKAASTSWMYNFNLLAGYTPKFLQESKLVPLTLARRRYPRPTVRELQEALNDSVSFLIVRHPLERLLSAYRDKIQFSLRHTLHQKLGNEIILKYRDTTSKNGLAVAQNPRWPTFSEFVQYLVDVHRKGEPFDMHWTPITHFCTPCQVDFDVIGKFETLQEDQNYLIHHANLQDLIRPEWKNPGKGQTSELVVEYYSQLTRAQILQIYNIYQHDFELFRYTLDGYLDIAMNEDSSVT